MTVLDTRLNRTMYIFAAAAADFPLGKDSLAVNLDTSSGEGIEIYGFDGFADMNPADAATISSVQVYILRNSIITTQSIATQFFIDRYEVMHFSASESVGLKNINRDFSTPFLLPRGSRYTVLFFPNMPNPANGYNLFFTVRGDYIKSDMPRSEFYGQSR